MYFPTLFIDVILGVKCIKFLTSNNYKYNKVTSPAVKDTARSMQASQFANSRQEYLMHAYDLHKP